MLYLMFSLPLRIYPVECFRNQCEGKTFFVIMWFLFSHKFFSRTPTAKKTSKSLFQNFESRDLTAKKQLTKKVKKASFELSKTSNSNIFSKKKVKKHLSFELSTSLNSKIFSQKKKTKKIRRVLAACRPSLSGRGDFFHPFDFFSPASFL